MISDKTPSVAPAATELVERLLLFDALRAIPRAEVEWLVLHSDHRFHATGEVLLTPNDEAREMIVQLTGRIAVYFGHGAGRRHVAESRAGSITGLLPFSRLKSPPADVLVEEAAEIVAMDKREFPALIRECPALIASLVHNMLDRARRFAAADWQDEKAISLGRLASGLAHELNNPASAASSGARRLVTVLRDVARAAHAVGLLALSSEQRALVLRVVAQCQSHECTRVRTPIDSADLDERYEKWLSAHGAPEELSILLERGEVPFETLDELARALDSDALSAALEWIALSASAAALTAEVERATHRIHDVVAAVRDFTHMDRPAVRAPVEVARGLTETIEVLRSKADAKDVLLTLQIAEALPRVSAVAPDLNQVWANLIDNAIDAAPRSGHILVRARCEGPTVVVSVTDDGTGISEEVQPRIFDPFFTTKEVGKGIGLGLDIVRRTVRNFSGEVEFESRPAHTEFRVRLPAVV
jgi:signal transduction histidine kinase